MKIYNKSSTYEQLVDLLEQNICYHNKSVKIIGELIIVARALGKVFVGFKCFDLNGADDGEISTIHSQIDNEIVKEFKYIGCPYQYVRWASHKEQK